MDSMDSHNESPFSQEILNRIFTISSKHLTRLSSRESTWLEFKESFSFGSLGKYLRSAAAFANAKGGYIVYGVKNEPHTMSGLRNSSFDKLDPAKLSEFLNEHFDPEIHWARQLYELNEKVFGLLHFSESENKPVICKKGTSDGKSLKEGEIYYRYSARTQVIRYPELKQLIDNNRKKEQELWFKTIKEIARIGVADSAVLDLHSGVVKGSENSFLIEENLLSQLSFIKEGEFSEIKGIPTLKLIGNLQSIGSTPIRVEGSRLKIVKVMGIRAQDIISAFLKGEKIADSSSYIKQICYEPSAFLPVYFLGVQMKIKKDEIVNIIDNEGTTSASKGKLLERLTDDRSLPLPMPFSGNSSGKRKLKMRAELLQKKISVRLDLKEIEIFLDMIRTLKGEEIDEVYLKKFLLKIFNKYYGHSNQTLNGKIRRTACYLDWILNKNKI